MLILSLFFPDSELVREYAGPWNRTNGFWGLFIFSWR